MLEQISAKFLFDSKFVKINGEDLHYVDVGHGDPILFLHGVPASNYIWRNIIPVMAKHARCIAPDLIGMGKSAKPNINYRVFDHIDYINKFIDALELKNITLVLHGFGSMIGFNYLANFSANVKAVAFYESHLIKADKINLLSVPAQAIFSMLNDSAKAYEQIVGDNYLVQKLLPTLTLRDLREEEILEYNAPFAEPNFRKPLWQYLNDLKLQTENSDVANLMQNNLSHLMQNSLPKLLMYNIPGFFTTMEGIKWCKKHLANLQLVDLGDGHNFAQETNPFMFAAALEDWFVKLK